MSREEAVIGQPLSFLQAALFQWVNPKAWVITVGGLAAYTTPEEYKFQAMFFVFSALIVGGLCMAGWLVLGAWIKTIMRNERSIKKLNYFMAGLLVLSIFPMALQWAQS